MPSLKDIKIRINSVKSTRKITSAMKMVSAAKLNRAQKNITGILPYSDALSHILRSVLAGGVDFDTPLAKQREVERVAIVAFSSDSSLAGAYNSNVVKELRKTLDQYAQLPKGNVLVYTIGKKVYEAANRMGIGVAKNFEGLAAKPDYDVIAGFVTDLIKQFADREVDKVVCIYHHFKSAGSQVLTTETLLPIALSDAGNSKHSAKKQASADDSASSGTLLDYIVEPDLDTILNELLPKSLKLRLHTMLLDSNASEHAARVIAMQLATDNADELINDLTIDYNKSRQQAITNELLDIVGGSMK